MTLTSPPSDEIRQFEGNLLPFNKFKELAKELLRVTAPGDVVAWVAGDQVRKGSYTGTIFKQALYFMRLGFRLHEILVITKRGRRCPRTVRYSLSPENAFVFSRGRPKSINLIRDFPVMRPGRRQSLFSRRTNGSVKQVGFGGAAGRWAVRPHVWEYVVSRGRNTPDLYAHRHPAIMAEGLAADLISSWSSPGDLIFDPFCGAGTTCKMALLSHRYYLGMEINELHHGFAVQRMTDAHLEYRRKLDERLLGADTCPGYATHTGEAGDMNAQNRASREN